MTRDYQKKEDFGDLPGCPLLCGIFKRSVNDLYRNDYLDFLDAWLFLIDDDFFFSLSGLDRERFIDLVVKP